MNSCIYARATVTPGEEWWRVVIKDPQGRVIEEYTAEGILPGGDLAGETLLQLAQGYARDYNASAPVEDPSLVKVIQDAYTHGDEMFERLGEHIRRLTK